MKWLDLCAAVGISELKHRTRSSVIGFAHANTTTGQYFRYCGSPGKLLPECEANHRDRLARKIMGCLPNVSMTTGNKQLLPTKLRVAHTKNKRFSFHGTVIQLQWLTGWTVSYCWHYCQLAKLISCADGCRRYFIMGWQGYFINRPKTSFPAINARRWLDIISHAKPNSLHRPMVSEFSIPLIAADCHLENEISFNVLLILPAKYITPCH